MEHLATYLAGKRNAEFARRLGISDAFLSQLLSGKRRPSLDLAFKIERATAGLVPASVWASDENGEAA